MFAYSHLISRSTICTFLLFFSINLYSAPIDHGQLIPRSSPFFNIIGIAILIFLLIGWIVSKLATKSNKCQDSSSNKENDNFKSSSLRYRMICPDCKGYGYRYTEYKYHSVPGEYILCNNCRGFKHELNEDAKKLLSDYSQVSQFNSIRCKEEKYKNHGMNKWTNENQNNVKAEIISEGRSVFSLDEYNKKIEALHLSEKRKYLSKKFHDLESKLAICHCNGANKQCTHCYGTGKIFNEELRLLMQNYKASFEESKILYDDRKRIYGEGILFSPIRLRSNYFNVYQQISSIVLKCLYVKNV